MSRTCRKYELWPDRASGWWRTKRDCEAAVCFTGLQARFHIPKNVKNIWLCTDSRRLTDQNVMHVNRAGVIGTRAWAFLDGKTVNVSFWLSRQLANGAQSLWFEYEYEVES